MLKTINKLDLKKEEILKIENISKSYISSNNVLDSINLKILSGEFISLVGSSGAGKTTLLNIIGGHVLPDKGNIYLFEKDITKIPAYRRPINTIFQDLALFPHMNVRENIEFPLRMKKFAKILIKEMSKTLMEIIQILDLSEREIYTLSAGQKQRVAFARAVISNPQILLCDEPFSSLDSNLKYDLMNFLLKFILENKITTLYVTHDQNEALFLSDRIVVINNGKILQFDIPENIIQEPSCSFVAKFFRSYNVFYGNKISKNTFISNNILFEIPEKCDSNISAIGIKPNSFSIEKNQKFSSLIRCKIVRKFIKDNYLHLNCFLENGINLDVHINNFENIDISNFNLNLYYDFNDIRLFYE